MTTIEELEAKHELNCKIATMKNLIPAYRQRISDNNDIILKAQGENRIYEKQIDEMREFLKSRGEKEHTMAEWSKECGH
jgi:peptidoglycan hydrolase CwlO-like protein